MSDQEERERLERLVHDMEPGARLLSHTVLQGGISARTTALEVSTPDGSIERFVVRRHGDIDFYENPNVARDEYRLLEILALVGVTAPEPRYLDTSGRFFSRPVLVMEFVDGETEFEPQDLEDYVSQLAAQLAQIHSIDETNADLTFLSNQEDRYSRMLARPLHSNGEPGSVGRIRDALVSTWPPSQSNQSVLLHGDFWPGNVLWKDGRITAVIDWEDAALGDPLADVANCRLEVLWAFGRDSMDRFTQRYLVLTGVDAANLPHWDLCAAFRPASQISAWGLEEEQERTMRTGLQEFIDQALHALSKND